MFNFFKNTNANAVNPFINGTEFQVNTYTTNNQKYPMVAGLTNGGFVITWDSNLQDGNGWSEYGKQYDQNGAPVVAEFKVNTLDNGSQVDSYVSGLANGDFVVTWSSGSSPNYDIKGQRFNGGGTALNSEFLVNSLGSIHVNSCIAPFSNGGYVVIWSGDSTEGQRYDNNNNNLGSEFTVTSGTYKYPAVASFANDGFVVTWDGVSAQRYDSNGNAVGSNFQVNTYITGAKSSSSVSGLSDGGFVVVWQSDTQDGDLNGVYGQRYNSVGAAQGSEFQVNTYTTHDQTYPFVAGLIAGGFVVVWQSNHQDGSTNDVYAKIYDSTGAALGNETMVNSYVLGDQEYPSVASIKSGGFVVTWHSSPAQDGNGYGIYAKIFTSLASPTPPPPSQSPPSPFHWLTIFVALVGVGAVAAISVAAIALVRRSRNHSSASPIKLKPDEKLTNPFKPMIPGQSGKQASSSDKKSVIKGKEPIATQAAYIPASDLKIEFGNKVAEGSYGIVYKATYRGKKVIVKQSKRLDNMAKDEMQNEANMMVLSNHERIVGFYGLSIVEDKCSLVMELMPEYSLYELLNKHELLPWDKRHQIAMDITEGLKHLHEKNILHRDLKSKNVLLDSNLRAKLGDFGLAKKVTDDTKNEKIKGTPAWIAPEVLLEETRPTKEADMYSYGMVLWEIASRAIPFKDEINDYAIMDKVKRGTREEIPAHWNKNYGELISLCWKERTERLDINAASTFLTEHKADIIKNSRDNMPNEEYGFRGNIGTQPTI